MVFVFLERFPQCAHVRMSTFSTLTLAVLGHEGDLATVNFGSVSKSFSNGPMNDPGPQGRTEVRCGDSHMHGAEVRCSYS